MIINIRGTSGSGKTTLARHFMELSTSVTAIEAPSGRKDEAYECNYKGETVYLLGSYRNLCGGCDTISSQDDVHATIAKYKEKGHVLFEGLFISHIYGRYAEAATADPDNWVFFMLETPFDTCIDHIVERRVKQERTTELKDSVYNNARKTYDSTYRIREKMTRDGISWEELPMGNRFELFESLLDFYLDVGE